MSSTLGSLVLFVLVVGLVIVVGVSVGMIVAGRIDRRMTSPRPTGPGTVKPAGEPGAAEPSAEPGTDPVRIEEHEQ